MLLPLPPFSIVFTQRGPFKAPARSHSSCVRNPPRASSLTHSASPYWSLQSTYIRPSGASLHSPTSLIPILLSPLQLHWPSWTCEHSRHNPTLASLHLLLPLLWLLCADIFCEAFPGCAVWSFILPSWHVLLPLAALLIVFLTTYH